MDLIYLCVSNCLEKRKVNLDICGFEREIITCGSNQLKYFEGKLIDDKVKCPLINDIENKGKSLNSK